MFEVAAALAAAAALAIGYWLNRRVIGWMPDDPPGAARKQHGRPIPLAGILLLPVVLPWLLLFEEYWLAAAATVAALIGYFDDRGKEHQRDMDWRAKAVGLAVAATLAALAVADPLLDPWWFFAAASFAFVLTNATNFLDNMNGVASSLSAVSLVLLAGSSGPFAAVAFAALGFVLWNWPRALVFLGDAGAYLLGIVVATAAARAGRADWQALGAVAIQLADFTQVVVARIVLGLAPWVGDRRHLTHIVHHLGVPRPMVAPVFALLAVGIAMATRAAA